ncbi:hypothetical protein ABEB36_005293 [Hypothenemus hampei]|uniref:Phosphatidylserine decarboxylase n=1 Tax=Hypothenemus hampei TaxID=57062 RepID=A0ABD1F094_HYPHA
MFRSKLISKSVKHEAQFWLSGYQKVRTSCASRESTRQLSTNNNKQRSHDWTEWEKVLKRSVPLGVCLIAVMQWRVYRRKIREGTVANQWEINCYCFLPLRSISRCWGYLADKKLPEFARPLVYETYAKAFGVNLDEALHGDLKHYPSLADFFARPLKEGVRIIDKDNPLVSPCDGTVLSVGTVNNGQVEQVKGVTYYVKDFLGEKLDQNTININNNKDIHEHLLRKPHEGNTLYQCVIYLAPGDYHR